MELLEAKRKRGARIEDWARSGADQAGVLTPSAARLRKSVQTNAEAIGKNYARKDVETIDYSLFGDAPFSRNPAGRTIRSFTHLRRGALSRGGFALLLAGRPHGNRREPHHRMAVARKHNLVASLRASDKIGQMRFGFADRNIHGLPIPALSAATEFLLQTSV